MLHIKLIGMKHRTPLSNYSAIYTPSTTGVGSEGQKNSESGYIAYQNKSKQM